MTDNRGAEVGSPAITGAVPDSFREAKLRWPPNRAAWLRRQRLLARLGAACDHPVTLVAAPAGYGKTTLLTQWLDEVRPRAAWLSLDPSDNDPNQLWADAGAALERAGCRLDPTRSVLPAGSDGVAPGSLLSTIVDALAASDQDILLVLDDFHVITGAPCHAQVEFVIEHLPSQAHLVIVTRSDPGLRLGRLRASGGLLEIRADDLAFSPDEAAALLACRHIELGADAAQQLMRRTEGWPAGFCLALLSLAGRPDPDAFVRDFSGGNRYIGDYLIEEVLSRHSPQAREFILTVSILDRFSAELCDHVVGSTGSGSLLRELERTNLFLTPLDDDARWYRFHHLFAAVARSELDVQHPERAQQLHSRAAEWFRLQGHIDLAIRHSIAAGDTASASQLVQTHWLQFVDAGRAATVLGWLDAIGPPTAASEPAENVTAAWMAALIGDEATLSARQTALAASRGHGPLPDGSRSVDSAMAMIDALFGYGGPVEMMRGAELAVALETDRHSPFYALANATLGHAAYVGGDLERALAPLANAWRNDRAPVVIRVLALAVESLVHDERGDADRARERAEESMGLLEANALRAVPQASLAFTAMGRALAVAGTLDQALDTLAEGLALRRGTSAHGPWGAIHHLVVHARVAAEAGHAELARDLLRELDTRLMRFHEGLSATVARAGAVRQLLQGQGQQSDTVLGERLTGREADILRLLRSSMSLQEIADQLYVSSNTVKTHARAVYRKLGVHTREEAVAVGRRQGLV